MEPLRRAGVELDVMMLLRIQEMRRYKEAKDHFLDPMKKDEDIPPGMLDRIFKIQEAKLRRREARMQAGRASAQRR